MALSHIILNEIYSAKNHIKEGNMFKRQLFQTSLIVLMAFAISLFCLGKDEAIESNWADTPPKIDGLSQDWEGIPLVSQKHGVNLGFRNDEKYFYVLFVFTNPKYLTTVELTGMTLYFNPEGEQKKGRAINLRKIQLTADQFIAWMEKNKGPMSEEEKKKIKVHDAYWLFHCGIKKKDTEEIVTAEENARITPAVFRMERQQKTLIYEMAIPLEKATELAPGIGTKIGENLTVGFEWGGWTKELKQVVSSQMGAAGSRARDIKASDDLTGEGGDPRSVRGARMSDAPTLAAMRKRQPKKYLFWVDVKLVDKQ